MVPAPGIQIPLLPLKIFIFNMGIMILINCENQMRALCVKVLSKWVCANYKEVILLSVTKNYIDHLASIQMLRYLNYKEF